MVFTSFVMQWKNDQSKITIGFELIEMQDVAKCSILRENKQTKTTTKE